MPNASTEWIFSKNLSTEKHITSELLHNRDLSGQWNWNRAPKCQDIQIIIMVKMCETCYEHVST